MSSKDPKQAAPKVDVVMDEVRQEDEAPEDEITFDAAEALMQL